jgi:hypothetical protein
MRYLVNRGRILAAKFKEAAVSGLALRADIIPAERQRPRLQLVRSKFPTKSLLYPLIHRGWANEEHPLLAKLFLS